MNKNRFSPLFTKRLLRDSLVFDCLGKTFSLGVVTHRGAAVSDEAAGTAMFPQKKRCGLCSCSPHRKSFQGIFLFQSCHRLFDSAERFDDVLVAGGVAHAEAFGRTEGIAADGCHVSHFK